jgi:hypothetical protein
MMDVIAVLLVVVGFAIGWCLRGCHEDEKAAAMAEAAAQDKAAHHKPANVKTLHAR